MNKIKLVFGTLSIIALLVACGGKTKVNKEDGPKKDSVLTDTVPTTELKFDSASRNSADFKVFVEYFLNTCYYKNNFDSLMYTSSTVVAPFLNKEAGTARYFNRGAFCNLFTTAPYDYPFSDNFYGEKCTFSGLPFFTKKPVEGFCEESIDSNGVYYYAAKTFPEAWDMEKDKSVKVNLPAKFSKAPKMKVDIMFEKWIVKQFYFAQIDNVWCLVFIDDCDCSA